MTERQQKDLWDIVVIVAISLFVAFCVSFGCTIAKGQNVVRNGYQFEQVSKKKSAEPPVKTKYTYKTLDGKIYPIYISKKGKCFINRISKKDGHTYPDYKLPKELKDLIQKEYGFKKD